MLQSLVHEGGQRKQEIAMGTASGGKSLGPSITNSNDPFNILKIQNILYPQNVHCFEGLYFSGY